MVQKADLFVTLVDEIRTTEELERVRQGVSVMSSAVYQEGAGDIEQLISKSLGLKTSEVLKPFLKGDKVPKEGEALHRFFSELKEKLGSLEIVTLTLAFDPPEGFIRELSGKIRSLTGTQVILDLKVDKHLLGGVMLIYQGRYTDLSLRKRFDLKIPDNHQELYELLRQ